MPPTPVVLTAVVVLVLISMLAAHGLGVVGRVRALAVVVAVAAVVAPLGYVSEQIPKAEEHGGGGGSPERGKAFFRDQGGCGTCHTMAGISAGTIGPELTHVATVAETRKPGLSAEGYIRESIQSPTAFVAPGFSPQMPPGLASGQNLEDLVAFLMTKH